MSVRYGLRLVPQGSIPRDLNLTVKLQPKRKAEEAELLVGIKELPYDLIFALYADITAETVIGAAIIPRDVVLPSAAPGSKATCATAPAATSVFEIKKNDVKIGEITFAATETEGIIVVGSLNAVNQLVAEDVPIVAGDLIEVIASTDTFDTLTNVRVTLVTVYQLP